LASKLACEGCGKFPESYIKGKGWKELALDAAWIEAFACAKDRVRAMDLRYVEEAEPTRQALLEIYVCVALETPYNDFNTR
jgi:hypothetical protein